MSPVTIGRPMAAPGSSLAFGSASVPTSAPACSGVRPPIFSIGAIWPKAASLTPEMESGNDKRFSCDGPPAAERLAAARLAAGFTDRMNGSAFQRRGPLVLTMSLAGKE